MLERHTIQHTIGGVIDSYRELAAERGLRRPPLEERAPTRSAESLGSLGLMPSDALFTEPR
jgi:hypothetical protein